MAHTLKQLMCQLPTTETLTRLEVGVCPHKRRFQSKSAELSRVMTLFTLQGLPSSAQWSAMPRLVQPYPSIETECYTNF